VKIEFWGIYQMFSKRFEPLKNWRKNSMWSCSQFYNLNSVGNWKWTQWEKLFIMINSSTIPSFNIFWHQDGLRFVFWNWSKVWIIGKNVVHRIGPNPYLQYQPNRLNWPEPTGQTAAALTCKPHTAVRTTAAIGGRCFPSSTALATVFPASAHRLSPHPRALTVPIHCCPWGSPRSQPLFCFLTPRSPASALLRAALRLA
jgi:hypothetical protein